MCGDAHCNAVDMRENSGLWAHSCSFDPQAKMSRSTTCAEDVEDEVEVVCIIVPFACCITLCDFNVLMIILTGHLVHERAQKRE